MARDKLSSNPVAESRKKEKEKERKKCKVQRAQKYEDQFVRRTEGEVDKSLDELRSRQTRDMLGHTQKGKLERIEKLLKKHGDKLEQRWQKQSVVENKKAQDARVEKMAEVAIFSVYYDRESNPYGIPPPGKPPCYRHPDGATRPHPPFQKGTVVPPPPPRTKRGRDDGDSDSSSSSEDAPRPPPCPPPPQNLPPGFTYNPTTLFQHEVQIAQQEKTALEKASTPYRPPLPTTLPAVKNKPPLPKEPPPDRLIRQARERAKPNNASSRHPTFDEVIEMAKQEARNEAEAATLPQEAESGAIAAKASITGDTNKPSSFVPTVLRTKQARVDNTVGEQVSALSLAFGSENVRSSMARVVVAPARKPEEKKKKKEKKEDMDAAFDSFMKEV